MKPILMLTMASCPYCQKALGYMDDYLNQHPDCKEIQITKIDENLQPDVANLYDYYYVPSYFVDGVKVHEGAATPQDIARVFELAQK